MKVPKFCGVAVSSGLLIGALVGWHFGRTITDGQLIWEEMFAAAGYGQLALLQYEEADTPHARQALLSLTDFARSMSKLPSAEHDQALMIDAGRSYLMLAALEQLAGNNNLSHQYVLSAHERFKSIGRDIPEVDLNKQVAKIVKAAAPVVPSS
jgi:hypothetical protein